MRLLEHLAWHGVRVPVTVPAKDGRRHVGGVLVMRWLEGSLPEASDWPVAADALRRVHEVTRGWPQRPDAASTRQLLTGERGGDVNLGLMPAARGRPRESLLMRD